MRRAAIWIPWALAPAARRTAAEGTLTLTRLPGPVAVDGRPTTRRGRRCRRCPSPCTRPPTAARPAQRTEIRVAYDDEALYAAGWFYDDEPRGHPRQLALPRPLERRRRVRHLRGRVQRQPNAKWFGTTPAAMRFDVLVSDDGAKTNESWDGYWDAKTVVTGEGWFAEVRIPFSTLGFQARGRARGHGPHRDPPRVAQRGARDLPRHRPAVRVPAPSQRAGRGARRRAQPDAALPDALRAGRRERRAPRAAAPLARRRRTSRARWARDLRYALSGTLTLDLTANTDFAQVEADEEQVALDRFPLFFPEKRRFFQEGSGIFDFATTGGGQLFHSRRIGLTDDRRPVPVLGGARLVGRAGAWDVGLLDMQTDGLGGDAVRELRRAAPAPRRVQPLLAGGLHGHDPRAAAGGTTLALGVDGIFRVHGDEYLTLKWAGTVDDADPAGAGACEPQPVERELAAARPARPLVHARRAARGPRLPARAGLPAPLGRHHARTPSRQLVHLHRQAPLLPPRLPGRARLPHLPQRGPRARERHLGGLGPVGHEGRAAAAGSSRRSSTRTCASRSRSARATIPAGTYTFADLQVVFTMPTGARLRTDVDARAAPSSTARARRSIVTPTWNLSRHLELGA